RLAMWGALPRPPHSPGAAGAAPTYLRARSTHPGGGRPPHHRPRAVGDW
ncbi:hypothetical protein ABIE65_002815, partial [Constrictibacter sp. MBR-5]